MTKRALAFLFVAFGLSALVGCNKPVAAQEPPPTAQASERVALVIGISNYPGGIAGTALNDAALVSETLKGAGFEVVQGADLDEQGLRKAVREFLDRMQAAGPNGASVVYFAGRGLQFEGDNFMMPAGATLTRASDVPLSGFRVSDLIRSMAAVPSKLHVVMLDGARDVPNVEGQPLAQGLAIMDAPPGFLVAESTAPNLILPQSPGPYGAYAKAVVEMIRQPGLGLDEMFAKIRLRVNEGTGGQETPWHAANLQNVQFSFFAAEANAAPPPPPESATSALKRKPLRELGAEEAYSVAVERDEIPVYQEFLRDYPNAPTSRRVAAMLSLRREAIIWRQTRNRNTPEAYWTYLQRYPNGLHAADADRMLARLSAPIAPPPRFNVIEYDDLPPPLPVVEDWQPVEVVREYEVLPPPPPPPIFLLPPPPPELIVLPPPPPPPGPGFLPVLAPVAAAAIIAPRWAHRPPPPPPPVIVQPVVIVPPAPQSQPVRPTAVQPQALQPNALQPNAAQPPTAPQQGQPPRPGPAATAPAPAAAPAPTGPAASAPALRPQQQAPQRAPQQASRPIAPQSAPQTAPNALLPQGAPTGAAAIAPSARTNIRPRPMQGPAAAVQPAPQPQAGPKPGQPRPAATAARPQISGPRVAPQAPVQARAAPAMPRPQNVAPRPTPVAAAPRPAPAAAAPRPAPVAVAPRPAPPPQAAPHPAPAKPAPTKPACGAPGQPPCPH